MKRKKFERQIQQLLDEMTLEEKIGQLDQRGPSLVGAFDVEFDELINMLCDGRISKEKFNDLLNTAKQDFGEDDLRAGKIGSYNGISDPETILRLQKIAVEETRLGIPLLFGYDVIHGYRTATPIPLAESCAWEPELWERTARMAAEESTAGGIQITFAPMVDVSKDARWGRIAESAGEDTLINARYGEAKVKGFQGEDLSKANAMAACVKHFAAYGFVEGGRDYNRVDMSPQKLFEEVLPPFEACIRAGAMAVMPAFNDLSGVPCSVNRWLLTDVLRERLGFDGMTISDANAIDECVNHGVAADRADAARQALEAGMDMDMTSGCFRGELKPLIESGQVDQAALDRAVADVLRIKFELGLFHDPYQTSLERAAATFLSPQNRALAREAAQKSIVLLKNENGLLPLKGGTKLGLVGKLAEDSGEMMGTWALKTLPDDCISLAQACSLQGVPCELLKTPQDIARTDCPVFIAAIGEFKAQSGEAASRTSIALRQEDIALLEAMVATGKPVVAVVFGGRPLALGWLKDHIHAILEAWHPGIEAGNALVDLLFGIVNPSAKLTVTFPGSAGQCPMYYDHINTGRPGGKSKFTSKYLDAPNEPIYHFGYGLSYTSFAYQGLQAYQEGAEILVSVCVQNTGDRAGDEIVQCYFRDPVAHRARPVQKLVDFAKISLAPKENQIVSFRIPLERFGYYNSLMEFIVDDGEIEIQVGGCSCGCLHKAVDVHVERDPFNGCQNARIPH